MSDKLQDQEQAKKEIMASIKHNPKRGAEEGATGQFPSTLAQELMPSGLQEQSPALFSQKLNEFGDNQPTFPGYMIAEVPKSTHLVDLKLKELEAMLS